MLQGYERRAAILVSQWYVAGLDKTLALLRRAVKASEAEERADDIVNAALGNAHEEQLKRSMKAFTETVVNDFGNFGLESIGITEANFNINNPVVAAELRNFEGKLSDNIGDVNTRLKRDLGEQLAIGFAEGEGYNQLAARTSGIFKKGIRATRPGAMRIAATEVSAAANFGLIEGYDQSGAVVEKEWLSAFGARETHGAASGQRVKLKELFTVGGEKARYPGDPRLSAGERINCRCTTIPHVVAEVDDEFAGETLPDRTPGEAIVAYQDYGYQSMNGYHRGHAEVIDDLTPDQVATIKADTKALDSVMQPSKTTQVAYRADGASISASVFEDPAVAAKLPKSLTFDEYLADPKKYDDLFTEIFKGRRFKDKAYTSTAFEKPAAEEFLTAAGYNKNGMEGLAEIVLPPGTNMVDVESISTLGAGEAEALLARGTEFEIKRVSIGFKDRGAGDSRLYFRFFIEVVL